MPCDWCRRVPSLDVGVHLTLVAETPLRAEGILPRPAPTAASRPSAGAFLRRYLSGPDPAGGYPRGAGRPDRARAGSWRAGVAPGQPPACARPAGDRPAGPGAGGALRHPVRARAGRGMAHRAAAEPSRGLPAGRRHGLRACWMLARAAGADAGDRGRCASWGFTEGGRLDQTRLRRLLPVASAGAERMN
ncbi:MAG: hypothetical protein MZU91_07370 [Desulfosudis oleivorans]|nr:hypothetical protein [Desulfosudis oleivorans]